MENTLILGLGRVGKTVLTAEYVTTEDLDCDKYIVDINRDLRQYIYYLDIPSVHNFESAEVLLKKSRSNTNKVVLVVDDIASNRDWKHISEVIDELKLTLKDRLVIWATAGLWLAKNNSRLTEIINTYNFTNVIDIDDSWVLTPSVPAKLFNHGTKEVIKTVDINALAGKWFKVREENSVRFNIEASDYIG